MEGGAAASPTVSVRAGVQGWSGETDTFGSGDKPEDSTALPVPPWGWDAGLLGSLLVTLGGGGNAAWEGGKTCCRQHVGASAPEEGLHSL